jgi:spore coat polysaccharide biosynthesis protein SpsF
LAAKAGEASLADLLLLLEREPGLRTLNDHVKQKAIAVSSGLALIRCDGGGRFGYGHVKRMVALARALRDRQGLGALFVVNGTADALEPIARAGFEAILLDGAKDAMTKLVQSHAPDILVCDLREGIDREELERLSKHVSLTVAIDDTSDRRLAADLAYYTPVPQAEGLDWHGSACVARIGWEWALLGMTKPAAAKRAAPPRPTLLVSMGGSDPAALTLRIARVLTKLNPVFRARFVIGPGMENRSRIARAVASLASNFETLEGAADLAAEYAASDLALAAFGVTAYELAATGVPALYLCLTDDHALSASSFEQAGMGLSLGLAQQAQDEDIARAVWALLSDSPRRREMRAAGLMTIDGEGVSRIAADLAQMLGERRARGIRAAG